MRDTYEIITHWKCKHSIGVIVNSSYSWRMGTNMSYITHWHKSGPKNNNETASVSTVSSNLIGILILFGIYLPLWTTGSPDSAYSSIFRNLKAKKEIIVSKPRNGFVYGELLRFRLILVWGLIRYREQMKRKLPAFCTKYSDLWFLVHYSRFLRSWYYVWQASYHLRQNLKKKVLSIE